MTIWIAVEAGQTVSYPVGVSFCAVETWAEGVVVGAVGWSGDCKTTERRNRWTRS